MENKELYQYSLWSELPEHLVERIMEFLPLECLFRFRAVCNGWKEVLSGNRLSGLGKAAAKKQPWLVLCMPMNTQMGCLVYSFFTRSWRTLSLSFLPEVWTVNSRGSAAGLLLVDIPNAESNTINANDQSPWRCVCNPLTQSFFRLPAMLSIRVVVARAIVPVEKKNSYKVVVVGKCGIRNAMVVEVYNSETRSWRIAGNLPPSSLETRNEHVVISNVGSVFCMAASGDGIIAYNTDDGSWATLPMPTMAVTNNVWPRLIACGALLFIVKFIKRDHVLREVIMWEFPLKARSDLNCRWKEIGRMPESVCADFQRMSCSGWIECLGVGDYMCFRAHTRVDVVVYSHTRRSWEWLPKCPCTHPDCHNSRLRGLALEPRPDMEVS